MDCSLSSCVLLQACRLLACRARVHDLWLNSVRNLVMFIFVGRFLGLLYHRFHMLWIPWVALSRRELILFDFASMLGFKLGAFGAPMSFMRVVGGIRATLESTSGIQK